MPKAGGLGAMVGGSPMPSPSGGMPPSAPVAGGPPASTAPYGTGTGGPDAAGPSVGSGSSALPQPMLQGILEAGVQIGLMYDSFARATPDLSGLLDAARSALQEYLGQLMVAGAGPTGPTAPGQPFPGGGFDRGPLK